jgi:hypothetical protein
VLLDGPEHRRGASLVEELLAPIGSEASRIVGSGQEVADGGAESGHSATLRDAARCVHASSERVNPELTAEQ